jgi:hypothetical protein
MQGAGAYQEDQRGYRVMLSSLKKLADYAKANHIRLYLAMTPDVHNLGNYPFGYIHERMHGVAEADGYTFVDLLPALGKLSPDQVWAMLGDPHPNALGHHLMAKAIFPVLGTGAAEAAPVRPLAPSPQRLPKPRGNSRTLRNP